jgi:hypothetical protein
MQLLLVLSQLNTVEFTIVTPELLAAIEEANPFYPPPFFCRRRGRSRPQIRVPTSLKLGLYPAVRPRHAEHERQKGQGRLRLRLPRQANPEGRVTATTEAEAKTTAKEARQAKKARNLMAAATTKVSQLEEFRLVFRSSQ